MRNIAIIFIIASLYTITAELSEYLAIPGTIIASIWPPSGIAFAAVLLYGDICLIAVFIGCFLGDFHLFTTGGVVTLAILNATASGLGATIQAYIGKRAFIFLAGTDNIFKNTRSVLTFILIPAFSACVINASIGTSVFMLSGTIAVKELPYAWVTWWIADSVGVITVASTLIAWHQTWREKISIFKIINLIITWGLILLVEYILIKTDAQLTYLLMPFAIWAAFQFDLKFSLLTGLLISSVCLYDAIHLPRFVHSTSMTTSIILIQIFISITFLTILLIHAILTDRQKAYANLQLLNMKLEKRVQERTKDLSDTNQQLEIQKNKAFEALEALKYSHARLMQSEKMASLGLLTAGVAHEVKNPLNAISANINSIKATVDHIIQSISNIPDIDNVKSDINRNNENIASLIVATNEGIKRTAGIMEDLRNFSKDEPEMVMTDLNKNIDSTLNLLSSEIKGNDVKIIKEYGEIPELLCHPGKLNQVIMNILINAIHALQTKREGTITIKTQTTDHSIELHIKDNGPGIKKEIIDKIFTPFFTTKQSSLGSGLGLFISYNIIREHNGTLSVKSEPEKGTEFMITLPIKKV